MSIDAHTLSILPAQKQRVEWFNKQQGESQKHNTKQRIEWKHLCCHTAKVAHPSYKKAPHSLAGSCKAEQRHERAAHVTCHDTHYEQHGGTGHPLSHDYNDQRDHKRTSSGTCQNGRIAGERK